MVNPAMRSTTGAAVAIGSRPLHPFFEKIIDKKVNQVAMGVLERLATYIFNFLCDQLYTAYRKRLQFRLNEKANEPLVCGKNMTIVFHNSNYGSIQIHNQTNNHIVAVKKDKIYINSIPLEFDGHPDFDSDDDSNLDMHREYRGQFVLADITDRPGLVRITETIAGDNQLIWEVNTQLQEREEVDVEGSPVNEGVYYRVRGISQSNDE